MRKLDDLEAKGVQEVQIVNEGVTQLCLICKSTKHGVQSCPTLLAVQDMFSEQANALGTYKQYSSNSPYSNTYNPGWRNHPNLSWKGGNNGQFQQQGNQFQGNQTIGNKVFNHKVKCLNISELADIRTTLSQLVVVITLRNGKEYGGPKLPVSEDILAKDEPTIEKNARNEKASEKYEKVIVSKDKRSISNHLPFPSAMQRHKVRDKNLKILEILKQLSFGNMIVEMNVFNLCKRPMDHDDVENEEACLIEALVQEHKKLMEENINEFFSTIVNEECVEVATKWKEKCTIQSLNSVENHEESKNEEVEIRKPELKPLPHGLNSWVSPTQVVPKKNGITVVKNDEGKLIPTRLTTGCELLSNCHCIGGSGENTFTCPFGTYAIGIVLGHIISREDIQVDLAKNELISKLPSPTTVKEACQEAFEILKSLLTIAPIVKPPNWSLPFELMCDASDYAVGTDVFQRMKNKTYCKCAMRKLCGGHFASRKTSAKILHSGFYWPTMFQDCNTHCKVVHNVNNWGKSTQGPFPHSFGNLYILVGVDCVSKMGGSSGMQEQ
ncbi:hypothetical protein CK203_091036 [Vitis vinifera]|uniref:Reverse transcriptase/retrotransposon-derived protein RNase H-like domain-containing protein n=1 Tax=Vitis vinifera TaxID=29760 RepID=A0A438BUU7_VITVI|nr:hypothetical protein CK203_091036 [Vitis vinifera]